MLSWVIYLKTNLIIVKEIIIHEIFKQTIPHNTFMHFGKNWKNRFSAYSFLEKSDSSRDALKFLKGMIFIES